jgi:hypothetical protein
MGTTDFRTDAGELTNNDLSIRIFSERELRELTHISFLDIENYVKVSELQPSEIYHRVVAFPSDLQDYCLSQLQYIEDSFGDARQGLNSISSLNRERRKDLVAVHYDRAGTPPNGEKRFSGDLGGCSGGAILTGNVGTTSVAFSGIILEGVRYKSQDIMLVGIGAEKVVEVVREAIVRKR